MTRSSSRQATRGSIESCPSSRATRSARGTSRSVSRSRSSSIVPSKCTLPDAASPSREHVLEAMDGYVLEEPCSAIGISLDERLGESSILTVDDQEAADHGLAILREEGASQPEVFANPAKVL